LGGKNVGTPLWAILHLLPDCSNVSHGFEPCLSFLWQMTSRPTIKQWSGFLSSRREVNTTIIILAALFPFMTATLPLVNEVGGQRVTLRHVSNRLFPNRTGQFLSIRLSRDVAPPVLGLRGIHRTRWVLSTFPCGPSPCPGHYPRHLSTTATLSPCGSHRLGDPEVSSSSSFSARRHPFRWVPCSRQVAVPEAASSLQAAIRLDPSTGRIASFRLSALTREPTQDRTTRIRAIELLPYADPL